MALPFILYLSLSLLYLLAVPTGEAPDEPGHLQCIEQVSIEKHLPIVNPPPQGEWWSRGVVLSGRMCYHLPLYYVVSGYSQRAVQGITGSSPHFEFPPENPQWGDSPAVFAHDPTEPFWRIGEPAAVWVLRVEAILLGLVTVWAARQTAVRLFPGDPTSAGLAALLAAGWPQFLFMSRAISNDTLATAWAVVALVLLLDVGRPRRFFWAALVSCLAVLTKFTMLFTLGIVVVTWLLEWLGESSRRAVYVRQGLLAGLPILALTLLLALQPTLRLHVEQTLQSFAAVNPAVLTIPYWLAVWQLSLSSGYARFGWMNVPAPTWQAYAWWVLILLAGGLGLWRALRLEQRNRRQGLILAVAGVWAAGVFFSYLRINSNRFQPQFRFAFALLPLLAALAAAGLSRLVGRFPRWRQAAAPLLAAGLWLTNVWLLLNVLEPAYS
ncbi:MAG: DUF2142 domain-containing protein [Chloroflexota bacterium]